MATNMYKVQRKIDSLEQLSEILKEKLADKKYEISVKRADKGVTKLVSGNTLDHIRIKKNGYHGVMINLSDGGSPETPHIISVNSYTPSTIVQMITHRAGLLDVLIFRAIWGSGNKFYNDVDAGIVEKFDAKPVDTSLKNSLKQMFNGKTVLDQ